MATIKDTRRLDELVKQELSDYQAPESAADWAKMETILGVAPKASGNKINFPSFGNAADSGVVKKVTSSYVVIAALMLAGGGYLIYTLLKTPKIVETSAVVAPPIDTVAVKPVVVQPPVATTALPAENKAPVAVAADKLKDSIAKIELAAEEKKKEEAAAKEAEEKKEAELAEKKNEEKAEADKLKAAEKKREERKEEKRKAEKKEKDRLAAKLEKEKNTAPKETLKKSNNPIGLNFLRSVNLDSLKKQQGQQPTPPVNDTSKAPK